VEVNLSGWFLSDSSQDYRKYRLAEDTILPPGVRLTLRESNFNDPTNPQCRVPFAFSADGDDAFLVEADSTGALLRFVDRVEFPATARGTSIGRHPDGTGPVAWLAEPTFGATNSAPVPGYEAWAAMSFPGYLADELTRPTADPDGDGISNFAEYAFVLSPIEPDAAALTLAIDAWQDGLVFNYRTRAASRYSTGWDLSYSIEKSSDLLHWIPITDEIEILAIQPQPDASTHVTARLREPFQGIPGNSFIRISVF
jgi:hypothetical protein